LIPASIHKILQAGAYTAFVIETDEKKFAIYADPKVGQNIQTLLAETPPERPLTHELFTSLYQGQGLTPFQLIISEMDESNIFKTKLFLSKEEEGNKEIIEIDARPSDSLTLALVENVPIFVDQSVLDLAKDFNS